MATPTCPVFGSIRTSWSGCVVAGDEPGPDRVRRSPRSCSDRNGSLIGLPIGRPVRASRRTTCLVARDRDPQRVAADDGVADADADVRARTSADLAGLGAHDRHPVVAEGADEDVVARQADDVRAPADRDLLDDFGSAAAAVGVAVGVRGGGRGRLARRRRRSSSPPSASAAITPTAATSSSPAAISAAATASTAASERTSLSLRLKLSFEPLGRVMRAARAARPR